MVRARGYARPEQAPSQPKAASTTWRTLPAVRHNARRWVAVASGGRSRLVRPVAP
jgi:hypothetical protein